MVMKPISRHLIIAILFSNFDKDYKFILSSPLHDQWFSSTQTILRNGHKDETG